MENKNLILVLILSFAFLFGWQMFIVGPQQEKEQAAFELEQQAQKLAELNGTTPANATAQSNGTSLPTANGSSLPSANTGAAPKTATAAEASLSLAEQKAQNLRVFIESARISGSIALIGGRVDDISLNDYREELDETSPDVTIFSPSGTEAPYYADFGWAAVNGVAVPTGKTRWTRTSGKTLTETTPVTLSWDNGAGITFNRVFTIDKDFLITIEQSVKNSSAAEIRMQPYSLISRHGTPTTTGIYILHEGLVGVMGEEGLQEIGYSDVADDGQQVFSETGGWLGFTDKYFATAIIPPQGEKYDARYLASGFNKDNYQTDYLLAERVIGAGGQASVVTNLFVGAKEDNVITAYRDVNGFEKFDLLIDWGIFYFITKPLFWLLNVMNGWLGNFGFSILAVTLVVKAIFYPLASKSYASMGKMKKLQPQIAELKLRFADDKTRLQQAQMELFKKEKVNPMAGCWPMLLQIPVFFALYKVLYIAIEMRQAPFFGWVQDLSAPDPTSVFNLFGLVPIDLPLFLMIGVWPILMGITQFVQMRLNPAPTDKIQAMVFGWMPVFFTFLLASFPVGMVIYWTWSNFLGIAQQAYIMKKNGVEISLWDNISALWSKKPKADAK
ncbi:MAG: membrane protein insertase YidC [Rhizobiales bacterium]|nr:membrane protein insertase YidC [Hyphomicrobiales bacterium]NRB14287.1 membrane protein insertase YidC [Hyphomicrobiales bacterium]